MSKRCLIVEDDPQIIDVIAETMSSIRHEFKWVTNQQEARTNLESEKFDYVLLDLEIPARPTSGTPMKEHGVRVLDEIQRIMGFRRLPVIIMSGYVAYALNRSNELRDKGATEFIAKPFPEEGRTLGSVIEAVLEKHAAPLPPSIEPGEPPGDYVPFSGGEMVFSAEGIELLGVQIVSDRGTGQCLMVAQQLRRRDALGEYLGQSADEIARAIDAPGGGQAVTGCIYTLRKNIARRLREQLGIQCGPRDVISHDSEGYRYRDWIVDLDADGRAPTRARVRARHRKTLI